MSAWLAACPIRPQAGHVRDALHSLRIDIGRTTVKRILEDAGVVPAPERSRRTIWKQFLATHWDALAAVDFFTAEVLTWGGLVRYHVLFVLELATRRVHIAGSPATAMRPGCSRSLATLRPMTASWPGSDS